MFQAYSKPNLDFLDRAIIGLSISSPVYLYPRRFVDANKRQQFQLCLLLVFLFLTKDILVLGTVTCLPTFGPTRGCDLLESPLGCALRRRRRRNVKIRKIPSRSNTVRKHDRLTATTSCAGDTAR